MTGVSDHDGDNLYALARYVISLTVLKRVN